MATKALNALIWGLTNLETPQPIALDLRDVTEISSAFTQAFFVELIIAKPESYFGPHHLVAFGASRGVARALTRDLAKEELSLPIAMETG